MQRGIGYRNRHIALPRPLCAYIRSRMIQNAFEQVSMIRELCILSLEIRQHRLENHITGRADELIFGLSEFAVFPMLCRTRMYSDVIRFALRSYNRTHY